MNEQLLQKTRRGKQTKGGVPRYVLLWEKIRETEARLGRQEAINEAVLRQFATIIRPLEEKVTHLLSELTRDLMNCFHHEDSVANRSLFGFWIIDNFATLASHPFADRFKVEELYDHWRLPLQGTDDMVEAQLSLLMAGRVDLPGQDRRRANYPDADLFADPFSPSAPRAASAAGSPHAYQSRASSAANDTSDSVREPNSSAGSSGPQTSDTHSERNSRKPSDTRKKTTRQGKTIDDDLGELFNVETLFRRIARAVHPDREQDEAKKAEKHAIMSACLKARENENIAQLLSLYALHVGHLPENWSNESTGDLVIALEEQLRALETRSLNLQHPDPVLQLIQERYLSHDMAEVDNRIGRHRDALTNEIQLLQQRREQLNTDEGVIEALDERRDIEMDKLVVADLTR